MKQRENCKFESDIQYLKSRLFIFFRNASAYWKFINFSTIFILHSALDGGVVSGLRRDKHGKSLGGYMLNIPISVNE